jgi:predicted nucleic acid-binding protein
MTIRGITLDTGALVAIERRKQRGTQLIELDVVNVEPLSLAVAKAAGEAQAHVPKATAIDAIVMAFAASRGDVVFTGDPKDLERLRAFFPGVRVLS